MRCLTPFQFGWKVFGTFVVAVLLSAIVILGVSGFSDMLWVQVVSQICSFIIAYAVPYSFIWKEGCQDFNRVKFGHMDYNKYKGLFSALYATIPSAFLWVVTIICKLFGWEFLFFYKLFNVHLLYWITDIFGKGNTSIVSISWSSLLIQGLFLLILPLFGFIAYIAGFKQFSITEKIVFTGKKK